MQIPPPPDVTQGRFRFFQILTPAAEEAVRRGNGLLFNSLVKTIMDWNPPPVFETEEEVKDYLRRYLWPPDDVLDYTWPDLPHIPRFPAGFDNNGNPIQVLIEDLEENARIGTRRLGIKMFVISEYGGTEGLKEYRRKWMSVGRSSEEFADMFRSTHI